MQRALQPADTQLTQPAPCTAWEEQRIAQLNLERHFRDVIYRGGIDPRAYEDLRWQLARRIGCSVEGLDEVLARFMLQFNLKSTAP